MFILCVFCHVKLSNGLRLLLGSKEISSYRSFFASLLVSVSLCEGFPPGVTFPHPSDACKICKCVIEEVYFTPEQRIICIPNPECGKKNIKVIFTLCDSNDLTFLSVFFYDVICTSFKYSTTIFLLVL